MYLNSFSVRVLGGKELPGGYVELEHGRSYCLVLRNDRPTDCDARVEIDGNARGTWRIPHNTSITLERPALDNGRFTFYEAASTEAGSAGLAVGDPNLGLVKVTFTPCLPSRPQPLTAAHEPPAGGPAIVPPVWAPNTATSTAPATVTGEPPAVRYGTTAAIGLADTSTQVFGTAEPLVPDLAQQTAIHLRLVGRHCRHGSQPRPLTAFSTPVPPAVR